MSHDPNRLTTGSIGLVWQNFVGSKLLTFRQKKCRKVRADEILTPSEIRASESDIAHSEGRARGPKALTSSPWSKTTRSRSGGFYVLRIIVYNGQLKMSLVLAGQQNFSQD